MNPKKSGAYSLIEVLIAGAILAIGITAAALMANALLVQEESNGFSLRAFNTQEQAARLWQLGLNGTTITNILPERCSSNANNPGAYSIYLDFSSVTTTNISGVGTVEILKQTNVFHSGTRADGSNIFRSNEIVVARPVIR
ncbi:MAG: prepilin-type N-terminal cleavage/methylation domain-containing protein [Verrucomicrobiae bacterium]